MKALPLPSPEVMLSPGYTRYYGQLRLPHKTEENFVSLYLPAAIIGVLKGLPCSPAWLLPRVTPATPEACLSVLVVIVRTDIPAFPCRPEGRRLPLLITRLRIGSLSLQPAGLLDPLKWAVVRELNASGYPLHLPQATWVNYRIPMAGL
jgi:hypothetical protein